MAHIGGTVYTSIKEAVKMSSEPFGLIACYQSPDGALYYFINGIPQVSIGVKTE